MLLTYLLILLLLPGYCRSGTETSRRTWEWIIITADVDSYEVLHRHRTQFYGTCTVIHLQRTKVAGWEVRHSSPEPELSSPAVQQNCLDCHDYFKI